MIATNSVSLAARLQQKFHQNSFIIFSEFRRQRDKETNKGTQVKPVTVGYFICGEAIVVVVAALLLLLSLLLQCALVLI